MKNKSFIKVISIISSIAVMFSLTACDGIFKRTESEAVTNNDEISNVKDEVTVDKEVSEDEKGTYILVDYTFMSDNEDDLKLDVPKEITKDGHTYTYTGDMEYEISEKMSVIEQTLDVEVEDKDEAEDTIKFVSDKTGKEYVLSCSEFSWSEKQTIQKKIVERVEYEATLEKPEIPETKELTYTNLKTDTEETVEGELTDWGMSDAFWAEMEEPITARFVRDASDFDYFETGIWNGDEEYKIHVDLDSEFPSWYSFMEGEDWTDDVLSISGADDSKFRVITGKWTTDKHYETEIVDGVEKVVEVREAEFGCEGKCNTYWAEYVGYGESEGYKCTSYYYATVEEALAALKKIDPTITQEDIADDISILYQIKATAKYKLVK